MDKGFITLHRQFLDWEWYTDTKTKILFIHCLLKANHTDKKWRGTTVKRGQFITSLQNLSLETGLSMREVRTCLKNLEKTRELDKQSTNLNTLISVTCYDKYQTVDKQKTNERQTKDKRKTTTNNDNNNNNNNKFIFKGALIDLGVDKQVASDWLKVRKAKSATNSETAFKSIAKNIDSMKDQLTPNEIITECVERSWSGLKRDWFVNSGLYKDATPQQKPVKERMTQASYFGKWMAKHKIEDPTAMSRDQKIKMLEDYNNNVEI